jgi:hypothetical protein
MKNPCVSDVAVTYADRRRAMIDWTGRQGKRFYVAIDVDEDGRYQRVAAFFRRTDTKPRRLTIRGYENRREIARVLSIIEDERLVEAWKRANPGPGEDERRQNSLAHRAYLVEAHIAQHGAHGYGRGM